MPAIILTKTIKFRPSGSPSATEKSFSFHGHILVEIIQQINDALKSIVLSSGARTPQFRKDEKGHFFVTLNNESQEYYEEDFMVAMIDVLERLGYTFRFQYDTSLASNKVLGQTMISREIFLFQKPLLEPGPI